MNTLIMEQIMTRKYKKQLWLMNTQWLKNMNSNLWLVNSIIIYDEC